MQPVIMKVTADGQAFVDFYQSLVFAMQESATVYVPLPVIAPNERRALPPPNHVLIALPSPELFHVVYQEMHKYLNWQTASRLTVEIGEQAVSLTHDQMPNESALREALFESK